MEVVKAFGIDGLVVIGGDGSLRASYVLYKEFGIPIINVPASIDNDMCGTDYTIGFDSAVNTAMEAIDKIRDTATSHERVFVIEVMGRESGSIAVEVGLVAGAEAIIIPEVKHDIRKIAKKLHYGQQRGKSSFIVVVAEGAAKAREVADELDKRVKNMDVRVSVLGHMQRGGAPSAISRETACKLGARAVELLSQGKKALMVGVISDKVIATPTKEVFKKRKGIDLSAYKLADLLAS